MNTVFEIDNLKCSGCASSIMKVLHSFPELDQPEVNVEEGTVAFSYLEGFEIQKVKDKLEGIGYPEKGTLTGIKKVGVNALSYVSCAIGKFSTDNDNGRI
ncbi:MAG TPA: heavy metal-associated domain-containing protein [Catalimonadaceae bacterium]|nr:heavy metal-associated domain-containing protein [Catalimonadaceae bacterium]HPI09410.1 heavy metal-associated domain-containing protein [Catalimonadaceae bacterium]